MQGIEDDSGVYLALQTVDFRRGIAALSLYAREHLGLEAASGIALPRPGPGRK